MTEPLSRQRIEARADRLIAQINFGEQAGHGPEAMKLLREAFDRLQAKATELGYGPLV